MLWLLQLIKPPFHHASVKLDLLYELDIGHLLEVVQPVMGKDSLLRHGIHQVLQLSLSTLLTQGYLLLH